MDGFVRSLGQEIFIDRRQDSNSEVFEGGMGAIGAW